VRRDFCTVRPEAVERRELAEGCTLDRRALLCEASEDRGLGRITVTCYMCDWYTCRKAKHIHKGQTHLLVREDVT
jgi:hypothetical protein